MREHPIIFSGESVRAILAGRKTQTRRVVRVRDQRDAFLRNGGFHGSWDDATYWRFRPWDANAPAHLDGKGDGLSGYALRCPFGAPGDRLWAREAFAFVGRVAVYRADVDAAHLRDEKMIRRAHPKLAAAYRDYRWRSPLHMPIRVSRITLEITAIRVERLRNITSEDAIAEGAWPTPELAEHRSVQPPEFRDLWDALNAKRGHGWATNPWVWALTFRRLEQGG